MKTRKLGIMLIASVLIMALAFAGAVSADASGTVGGIDWQVSDKDTKLTITLAKNPEQGYEKGQMKDYSREADVPWFANKSSITSVKLPSGLKNIGGSAFIGFSALTSVEIPASVTTIDDVAFCSTGLTSIEIPASVTTIGYQAINNCKNLTTVTFAEGSKLKTIDEGAFGWCTALKSIEIPASVTSIGNRAFSWTGLTSIEIPASVTSIGDGAFDCCWSLTDVTFADVSKLTKIGNTAFGPSGIKKVIINAGKFSSDPSLFGINIFYNTNLACVISKELQTPAVMAHFTSVTPPAADQESANTLKNDAVWYISEIQTESLSSDYKDNFVGLLNGGTLKANFVQKIDSNDNYILPTADDVILRDGYVLEGWYDDATLKNKHSGTSIVAGSPVYAEYKVYTAEKTTDATGTATFGGKNVLALQEEQSAVSKAVLESVSGLGKDTTVTFVADNTKIGEIPELSGYTKIEDVSIFEINVDDKVSGVATFEVTVTFASQKDAAEYGDKVRFVHYVAGAWQRYALESKSISKDGASIRYKVTTTSFSPFGISIQSINPARGHSASLPKEYTTPSYVEPMVQETAKPTTAPTVAAPTMMPTTKPTTQATQKSPAPLAGLIAGLGIAGLVLARMRR